MKAFYFYVLFSLAAINGICQAPVWRWGKTAGKGTNDQALATACDLQGNSFVTGYFTADTVRFGTVALVSNSANAFCLVKFDSAGNALWGKTTLSGYAAEGHFLATDAAGNVFVAGSYLTDVVFDNDTLQGSLSRFHTFLLKYDPSGALLWSRSGWGNDEDKPAGIATDASGNLLLLGAFESDTLKFGGYSIARGSYNEQMFVLKLDPAGNVQWGTAVGSDEGINPEGIAADLAGNCFITGYHYDSLLDFGTVQLTNFNTQAPFDSDIFLAKYDASGNLIWAQRAGGDLFDEAYAIAVDPGDNCYITGVAKSTTLNFASMFIPSVSDSLGGPASQDAFLAKYDGQGNVLWAHSEGAGGIDKIRALATDAAGNCYTAMETMGGGPYVGGVLLTHGANTYIIKKDSTGNLVWVKPVFGSLSANSLAVDPAQNSFLAGGCHSEIPLGNDTLQFSGLVDMFILSLGNNILQVPVVPRDAFLQIFPNPANRFVTITSGYAANNVYVYEITGRMVWKGRMESNIATFDLSSIVSGVYVVQLVSEKNKTVVSQRLVLE